MQPANPFNTQGSALKAPSKRVRAIQGIRNAIADGKLETATKLIAPFRDKCKDDAEMLFLFGIIAERKQMMNDAYEWAMRSLKIIEKPESLLLAARASRVMGNSDEAIELIDRIAVNSKNAINIAVLRGGTLEEAGRFDEARESLEPIVKEHTEKGKPIPPGILLEWSKVLVQFKEYDTAIEYMDQVVAHPNTPPGAKSTMYYLKAKAHDRAKRFDEAGEAAALGNEVGKIDFSPELYEEQVSVLMENWSRESMAKFPESKCESEIPVFVAGMPRSGTSLIDQIIDAHPKAAGVGELSNIEAFAAELAHAYNPDKPARLFGKHDGRQWTKRADKYVDIITEQAPEGAERIVNKALGNNRLVGLLAKLFPKTRIIHAIRDPRDVAISCYMGGFNNERIAWTTQVDWVSHAWQQSIRMMDYWKKTVDVPILDVHYERLVADPENEMPRIIEFLGLEWDDACRDFYKTKRTVRTLSYDQVNRPLYTSSSGRHKNYAKLIEGVEFPHYDPFAARD